MQTIELHRMRPGDELKTFLACKLFLYKKVKKADNAMDLHRTQPGDGWKEFFARKQLKLKIATTKIAKNSNNGFALGLDQVIWMIDILYMQLIKLVLTMRIVIMIHLLPPIVSVFPVLYKMYLSQRTESNEC